MTSFVISAILVVCAAFVVDGDIGYEIAEECVAEPPCQCYKQTEYNKNSPEGFVVNVVDCSNKRFSAVPFFRQLENTTVDRLLLQNNRIAVVPTDAFVGLSVSVIDLSGNKIDTIEENAFSGLESKLTTLILQSNRLRSLPIDAISKLANLEKLDLVSNHEIAELPRNSFLGLTSLRKLDLGNCPHGFHIHEDAFVPLQDTLQELMLKHCSLTDVPKALNVLHNLERLRLPHNLFPGLLAENFIGLNSLKCLDLTYNTNLSSSSSFQEDAFSEIGSTLQQLDLSGVGLEEVPLILQPFTQLKSLYLANNEISQIPSGTFKGLSSLEKLYIDKNPLQYFPGMFEGLTDSLNFISISSQNLTQLPNKELSALRELDTVSASGNNFGFLHDRFASGILATDYNFDNCGITDISQYAFSGKSTQVSLSLKGNLLNNLDFVQDPCYYWKIDVSDNPISCDCNTYKLSKYPHILLKGECFGPELLEGLSIGSTEFDNVMYWRCVDHFFEDTKLCSKWWLSGSGINRNSVITVTFSLATALFLLR